MSENKKLSQEEIAALLISRAREKREPVRALSDDELGSVAGGRGSYTISDKDGVTEVGWCTHPDAPESNISQYLPSGQVCEYGKAAGAANCYNCPYLQITLSTKIFY